MFECVVCSNRYTLDDVQEGNFIPSTSVCLTCYQVLYKNKSSCFGSDLYNASELVCQECPDKRICRGFVKHIKEFK